MQHVGSSCAKRAPVLVADADPAVIALASSALMQAGHVVLTAHDGLLAWRLLGGRWRPSVVILDWTLPGLDGATFCQNVRSDPTRDYTYLIVLGSTGRRRDAIRALEAGADEFVTKPFAAEELVAHVDRAQRILDHFPSASLRLRSAFEAASRTIGGEVIISRGEIVGRVFFSEGSIVWAYLSTTPITMASLLEGVVDLRPEDAHEVLEESKRAGRNFVEVLVQWGLVSEEAARLAVRRSIQQTIQALLVLEQPQVVFAPSKRGAWGGPKFALDEVVPPESLLPGPLDRVATASPDATVRCQFMPECNHCETVAATLMTELPRTGADGIAIVHRSSGMVLGSAGDPIDGDILRATLHILGVLSAQDAVDDVHVSGAGRHYLLRATACPDAFVSMVASRQKTNLGAVRHEVARIAGMIFPDEAATSRRQSMAKTVQTAESGPPNPGDGPSGRT